MERRFNDIQAISTELVENNRAIRETMKTMDDRLKTLEYAS